MADLHPPEPHCLNCGTELQGKFCHVCGQKASSLHLGMHDFVHEATHEFLHLDGKIGRTLQLLVTRPGQLTKELLEGRRTRYISPLRVYLTFSVLFFALASMVPKAGQRIVKVGPGNSRAGVTVPTPASFDQRMETATKKAEADAEKLGQAILHNLPRAMFLLMPVFGLITWAFYRRQQRYYIPHLYYAVHFHAFYFLLLSFYVLCSLAGRYGKVAGLLLVLLAIPYHFLGLRRVFGGTTAMTLAKGTAVGVAYLACVTAILIALVMWTLLSL